VWNDLVNDEKDYCIDDLKWGVAILTPLPSVADVPLRPLYSQKQDINCCQSEAWGWMSRFGVKKVNQETGDRYWRRLTIV